MGSLKNQLAVKPGFAQIGEKQKTERGGSKRKYLSQVSLIEYEYKGINLVLLLAFDSR